MTVSYTRLYRGQPDTFGPTPPAALVTEAERTRAVIHPRRVHVLWTNDAGTRGLQYGPPQSDPAWVVTFEPNQEGEQ